MQQVLFFPFTLGQIRIDINSVRMLLYNRSGTSYNLSLLFQLNLNFRRNYNIYRRAFRFNNFWFRVKNCYSMILLFYSYQLLSPHISQIVCGTKLVQKLVNIEIGSLLSAAQGATVTSCLYLVISSQAVVSVQC